MTTSLAARDIVVLGASSGGIQALTTVIRGLPTTLAASVFVVQHLSPSAPSMLAKILGRDAGLPVHTATHGQRFEHGHVYVAPPDQHLHVCPEHIELDRGPTQNRVRPAIDVLFRSAAVHHGARVIGVVLTGNLSDGSAGLVAIKRCGGLAMVQEPTDAPFPSMPRNAIAADDPDVVAPVAEIAGHITRAVQRTAPQIAVPIELQLEAQPMQYAAPGILSVNERIGTRAPMSCPECGGPLWRLAGGPPRFRCQIGHAYDEKLLVAAKTDEALRALWIAVRTLDERAHILSVMAAENRLAARSLTAEQYMLRHAELREASRTVRAFIRDISRVPDEAHRE